MVKELEEIEDIFQESPKNFEGDDVDQELEMPVVDINMSEINDVSERQSKLITERLADYYFSEEYLKEHPYIPTKIMLVMNNIRRLLKMLTINEKAQDSLILGVSYNAGKGSLYTSLTALQNSMLNIQVQLNKYVADLEEIFQKMQDECDKTFKEKDIEKQSDGSFIVRGAKELLKEIDKMQAEGKLNSNIIVDKNPINNSSTKPDSEKTAEELDSEFDINNIIDKK